MHKKALTAAIAGALAAPMAAYAVDFTISGRVSAALVATDSAAGNTTQVKDSGSSGSRFRFKGSSEIMEGQTVGFNLEYAAYGLALRYADIHYGGEFGKVSIGHGDQGGEGSVYSDKSGTLGLGHGQEKGSSDLGDYFGSLDGGGSRNGRLRYDAPAFGPLSAAVSAGNGDQISAGLVFADTFGGTDFKAQLGTLQQPGSVATISGSAGVKLPSGLTISGAWGKGSDHMGALDLGSPAVAAVPPAYSWVDTVTPMDDDNDSTTAMRTFDQAATAHQAAIDAGNAADADAAAQDAGRQAAIDLNDLFQDYACGTGRVPTDRLTDVPAALATRIGDGPLWDGNCSLRRSDDGMAAVPAVPDIQHVTDPGFVQATIGYVFGDTSVGVSWYRSSDMQRDGSKGTAIGIAANHNLPKVNAQIFAAIQNYDVEDVTAPRNNSAMIDRDDTVAMVGTVVKF